MRVISMYDIVTWLLCDAVFAFSITMFQLWLNYVWLKLSLTLYWLASFSVIICFTWLVVFVVISSFYLIY
jgi:hypothetical protein